jgi:hypothetical protein
MAGVAEQGTDGTASAESTAVEPTAADPVADPVDAPHRSRAGRMSSVTVLLALATVVAVGGIGFAAGRATATGQTGTTSTTQGGANGAANACTPGMGGSPEVKVLCRRRWC